MNASALTCAYTDVLRTLRKRLREPAPARTQILSGPRQVGKTTLLGEIADEWADQAIYAPADTPEAFLSGWWDNLWRKAEQLAARNSRTFNMAEMSRDLGVALKGGYFNLSHIRKQLLLKGTET